MQSAERMQLIESRLQKAFQPKILRVMDDSAKHAGHAGSAGGAGHYTVEIASDHFQDLSRVAVHRAVYAELNDLIPDEIHALRIRIVKQ